MIYGGVGRLQASAADCVGQPYHLPSDLIVTLLTELAQVENQGSPGRSLDRAARPPNRWIKRRLPCFCACASVRVACLWKTSLFSPSAADQCLPLRGRLCSRWPTLHECECWSLPFPPPSSGETGTTSFRKKGKKKKFLEFQAPWNYFVRQELSSEAQRFRREVRSGVLQFGAFLSRVAASGIF